MVSGISDLSNFLLTNNIPVNLVIEGPIAVHVHLYFLHFGGDEVCLVEGEHGVVEVGVANHVRVLGVHLLHVALVVEKHHPHQEINQTITHLRKTHEITLNFEGKSPYSPNIYHEFPSSLYLEMASKYKILAILACP